MSLVSFEELRDFVTPAIYNAQEKNHISSGAALCAIDVQHWEAQGSPKQKPYTVALENF